MTSSKRWRALWWFNDHAADRNAVMGRRLPSSRMRNLMVKEGQLDRVAKPFRATSYELTTAALDMMKDRGRRGVNQETRRSTSPEDLASKGDTKPKSPTV